MNHMSSPGIRASLVVALASCVLLAACDSSTENAPPPTSAAPAPKVAPKPKARLADQMVAAVSQGKNATAVGVHFMLGSAPVANQDLPLQIAIVPHEKFMSLRLTLTGQQGITVVSGGAFGPKTEVEPEKAFIHEVVLRPASEGVFTIGATVETEGGDGMVSRDYSIPVIVAPQAAPAAGTAPSTPPPAHKTPAAN
jgi:hypothetical protein